jgi:hypothetical protein
VKEGKQFSAYMNILALTAVLAAVFKVRFARLEHADSDGVHALGLGHLESGDQGIRPP